MTRYLLRDTYTNEIHSQYNGWVHETYQGLDSTFSIHEALYYVKQFKSEGLIVEIEEDIEISNIIQFIRFATQPSILVISLIILLQVTCS